MSMLHMYLGTIPRHLKSHLALPKMMAFTDLVDVGGEQKSDKMRIAAARLPCRDLTLSHLYKNRRASILRSSRTCPIYPSLV